MTPIAYALLAAATSLVASAPPPPDDAALPGEAVELAQLMIRQRIIVRIPAQPPMPVPRPVRLKEKHGPRCLAMASLGGAAITQPDSVDLYLRGGAMIRARLDDACPALDYYSGFYVSPTKDGMICADRDLIRTRSGGQCGIERFRTLVPER